MTKTQYSNVRFFMSPNIWMQFLGKMPIPCSSMASRSAGASLALWPALEASLVSAQFLLCTSLEGARLSHVTCSVCFVLVFIRCVRLETALRRMISVWHQCIARAIRKLKDPSALLSLSLMSFCAAPLQVERTYCFFSWPVPLWPSFP